MTAFYPIGTDNQAWTFEEKSQWLDNTSIQREYGQEVIPKIQALKESMALEQYGALSYEPERYPQYVLKSKGWDANKPNILITGGVHGYETSGVHGALLFASTTLKNFEDKFNFVIVPCVSPWGYETINRWNPLALDPNRSFFEGSGAEESENLMGLVQGLNISFLAHFDLHETTDSDETEFRPAVAARDGKGFTKGSIPDGYYTVDDTENPNNDFQKSIIDSVRNVTHIAPADKDGMIIGSTVVQEGVIRYPLKDLSLCASISDAKYTTTTEVYPDSDKVDTDECNRAQVAAIEGGLNYLVELQS